MKNTLGFSILRIFSENKMVRFILIRTDKFHKILLHVNPRVRIKIGSKNQSVDVTPVIIPATSFICEINQSKKMNNFYKKKVMQPTEYQKIHVSSITDMKGVRLKRQAIRFRNFVMHDDHKLTVTNEKYMCHIDESNNIYSYKICKDTSTPQLNFYITLPIEYFFSDEFSCTDCEHIDTLIHCMYEQLWDNAVEYNPGPTGSSSSGSKKKFNEILQTMVTELEALDKKIKKLLRAHEEDSKSFQDEAVLDSLLDKKHHILSFLDCSVSMRKCVVFAKQGLGRFCSASLSDMAKLTRQIDDQEDNKRVEDPHETILGR